VNEQVDDRGHTLKEWAKSVAFNYPNIVPVTPREVAEKHKSRWGAPWNVDAMENALIGELQKYDKYEVTCSHDPRELVGQPIGMYHCPKCGEMVVAGLKHT
jgi:hypothetical protein